MKRISALAMCLLVMCGTAAVLAEKNVAVEAAQEAAPEAAQEAAQKPDSAAIERTRRTVRMLDNIYKQTIVLITDKYVHDEEDFPAGSAAVLLFDKISKSGSHQVRLMDVTGEPYEEANVAQDDFEKEGVKRLRAGADYVEEVVMREGKPELRAMTPVPVVMQKCIMCHEHYADAKPGEAIGAISYRLSIE